ncbi:hypothetical protein [Tropicimonas sp. IMCC34043]|uniref:hypothetical protein n=1 Tax=Tropicimonas sp. IMCC34043 TaxID=2248760 RepID=UPI000E21F1EB|nr:hypothetical protein [Tropicimonas sp. IMCC34043]
MIEDLAGLLRGAVDEVFAEPLRHLPMAAGVPDTGRSPREIAATLRSGERAATGAGRQRRTDQWADGGELRIDREVFADLDIRQGDRIAALARAGQPMFEVMSVDARSHLRLICRLGDI